MAELDWLVWLIFAVCPVALSCVLIALFFQQVTTPTWRDRLLLGKNHDVA